ncbi:MAG TPA: hypothetical protein PLU88_11950 [Armatimonadota bacterium]|nr:hypothetical protein [Armatimonadota bacterium]
MSKFTIPTVKFQEMVTKASKGASGNKLLPITGMMAIELKNNVLMLTTTDAANFLKVRADKIQGDDFYAVVPEEVFTKLISKLTSENVILTLKENSVEVKGDGVYNIPLPMDEDGPVKFPEYKFKKSGEPGVLSLGAVKAVLAVNKAAVAKTIDTPCLSGYYVDDIVITTNENVICFNELKLLDDQPTLISSDMMELLALNTQENIKYYRDGSNLLFETDDVIVFGPQHDGINMFPVQEVKGYLNEQFQSVCKLPKLLLQNVIDRLSLFIEPYDKNGAYFNFTKDGLKVTSKKSSSVEVISYQESQNFEPFICCVDIPLFKSQIDAIPGEVVELWYGHPAAIKIVSGKVTQVIALLEDENLGANNGTAE